MSVASFVLVCALELMGRSAQQLPPILIVDRPVDATLQAVAFVRKGEPAINIIGTSPLFRAAVEANQHRSECRGLDLLRLLASSIAHEEWHLRHGPDERGAYLAQMTEIQRLGSGPGRWPYEAVRRAMKASLAGQELRARAAASDPPHGPAVSATLASHRPWLSAALESSRLPVLR